MSFCRATLLPFALPELGEAELREIRDVLDSGWLTTGPKTLLFEQRFAIYVGARFAVAVNSCTAAMHLALEAAGVQAGDFVITSPYTFAATAEVIRYFHAVPVFVDVEPDTLNIDPVCLIQTIEELGRYVEGGRSPEIPAVARALGETRSTEASVRASSNGRRGTLKAIMPVHFAGHPCDMDAIASAAREHQLAVIEDAAHACSASFRGRRIGSDMIQDVPSAVCFSFYATKTLATGEGGMVVTDREDWAERIRRMSLHGISKDAWKRYSAEGTWRYEITDAGYKYNMADIIAALGLAQLQKVDAMRERREAIALRYNEAFSRYSELETPTVRPGIGHAWHLYPLRVHGDNSRGAWRDDFVEELRKRNVSSSVHFIPLHLHPYYIAGFGYQPEDLPVAFREYRREVSLPIYSRMTDFDVESVIDAVVDIVIQARTKPPYALARC